MPEPLIIVGAGGHGRETAYAHLLSADAHTFLGFLDDGLAGMTPEGWPILGDIGVAAKHRNATFVVAINAPRSRRAVAQRLEALGVDRWGSVIHPDLRLHRSLRIGRGCSLLGGCQLTTNVQIGDHCILNRGCQIGHDCALASFCSVNPGACLAGDVLVEEGCEIGAAATLRQGVRVGRGATIGMAAVVTRSVEPGAVVVGNPARLLRFNPSC